MTAMVHDALLVLTGVYPLLLGLLWLVLLLRPRPRVPVALAASAALPGLLAALIVPVDTTIEAPFVLLGARFSLDATGQAFLIFTAVLWLAAGLYAPAYLRDDARQPHFTAFFLLAMAGNLGLIVAGDMLSFYAWYALMSFASYGLVIHTGQDEARTAGRIYLILVMAGEVLLFAAVVLIAAATGTIRLDELPGRPIGSLAAALAFVSFGIKAGVAMLHVWLPLAHPAAPVPASAVLSGAMIKAGLLGWLRFMSPGGAAPDWGALFVGAGLVTAFYGAVVGVSQVNAKTVLAYSSISQIGLIMVGVGAWLMAGEAGLQQAALTAVLLYAINHGLAKGALFLGVGFAGTGKPTLIVLLLPALALAGWPLTSGAVAKAALKSAAGASLPGSWMAGLDVLLPLAAVGTTLLMARFLWLIGRSPRQAKRIPPLQVGAWLGLVACVAVFLYAWPAAGPAVQDALKPDKLWIALWPVAAGGLLAGAVAVAGARYLRGLALPVFPPGDVLVWYEVTWRWLHRRLARLVESARRINVVLSERLSVWRASWSVGRDLTRWEMRLRADWVVAGSWLLILALAVLAAIWLSLRAG